MQNIYFESMPLDGNCFYHAIVNALNERDGETQLNVDDLRAKIIYFLTSDPGKAHIEAYVKDFAPDDGDATYDFLKKSPHIDEIRKYFGENGREAEQFEVSVVKKILDIEFGTSFVFIINKDLKSLLEKLVLTEPYFPLVVVDLTNGHYYLTRVDDKAICSRNRFAAAALNELLNRIQIRIEECCTSILR